MQGQVEEEEQQEEGEEEERGKKREGGVAEVKLAAAHRLSSRHCQLA